jgi:hypothetical protein
MLVALVVSFIAFPYAATAQDFLLFEDKFDSNDLGWESVGTDTSTKLEVGEGVLRLSTLTEGFASWAVPEITVPDNIDVQVTVNVISPASSGNWNFAILLRADTRDSTTGFYHFGIAGNGTYEFSVRRKGAESYAEVIDRGNIQGFNARRPFRLRVVAQGDTFVYSINNREVGTFTDDSLEGDPTTEKYIGLMSGTYENVRRNVVEFRDLQVFAMEGETVNTENGNTTGVLLEDQFEASNPNGWREGNTDQSRVNVGDNKLTIEILKDNFIAFTYPDTKFPADVDITVTALNPDPDTSAEWGYGVGYRGYQDGDTKTFYLFEVRGSGKYTVTTQNGGKVLETLITGTVRNYDPAATIEMRVVAKGDTHEFYVDGRKISTVQDDSLDTQDDYFIILEAGTFKDMPTMTAEFSNMIIKAAE